MVPIEIGKRFGYLTVIDNIYKQDKYGHNIHYCKCKCDCGNTKEVYKYSLLKGATISCGCGDGKQIIGERFGALLVIGDTDYEHGCGLHRKVRCACDCGNIVDIRASELRAGHKIDCGCQTRRKIGISRIDDLTGRDFGDLHVIGRDMDAVYGTGIHARWLCKCSLCGSVTSVRRELLLDYGKNKCSECIGLPLGEEKIAAILDDEGINYEHNTIYGDCIYPDTGYPLRFDFVIHNNGQDYIAEYDGVQHFKEIKHWEASTPLHGRQARDQYKNRWCSENGIPLIRIPYTHLNAICMEDLKPESSAFVV